MIRMQAQPPNLSIATQEIGYRQIGIPLHRFIELMGNSSKPATVCRPAPWPLYELVCSDSSGTSLKPSRRLIGRDVPKYARWFKVYLTPYLLTFLTPCML